MNIETEKQYFNCPFCGEGDMQFDKPGLKYHLEHYCEVYKRICWENPNGEANEEARHDRRD